MSPSQIVVKDSENQRGVVMRCFLSLLVVAWLAASASAGADDGQETSRPSGYGTSEPRIEYDVAYDGYGGVGRPVETAEPPTYPVVEADTGTTTEYEGETILVVKEPDPVAATSEAPPPPRVVATDAPVIECPSGVWVDGYWDYRAGRYVWVDGHCVEVRVNYVFVAPRWDFYWDIWWFIPGYYRPCGVFVSYGYYRPWHWFPPYPYPYYRTGRPIPEFRGTPVRRTVARPAQPSRVPSVTRAPRRPTTVIQTPPSRSPGSFSPGRAGMRPVTPDQRVRSRHGVDIVTEPEIARPAAVPAPSSGQSRGLSRKRPRTRPSSSGSGWTPSSGSSGSTRGWGGRSRSSPSRGSSSGSSSGGSRGGYGGKHR